MKILLSSTLKRKLSKEQFASRSRIIYQLASGLVKRGHTVSVLGTGDSEIPGVNIIPVIEKSWNDFPPVENPFVQQIGFLTKQALMISQLQDQFDIVHNHTYPDFFPHLLEKELKIPLVSTLHAVSTPYLDDVLSQFTHSSFVALSESYARSLKKTKPFAVVYNGVDTNLYAYSDKKEDYLFWIGRLNGSKNVDGSYMDPKGVRSAIQLAQAADKRLFMLGQVEDKKAFETDVKPHLNEKIQWIGETHAEQSVPIKTVIDLMQHACAFLMTVNQEEPFGLVMAEAMSCGTPVIAFDHGAARELVEDGKTGFVVDPTLGVEGLAKAVQALPTINPIDCRHHVEKHFSLEKMVENYEKVYQKLIKK